MEPIINSSIPDGDSELSFEALTFGDTHHNNTSPDLLEESPRNKQNKFKSAKKSPPPEDKGSAAVYISSIGDSKIDVQNLLKKLELFGVVKAYYFKEKQDFGFVQFLDPSVVDVVVENLSKNGLDGQLLSVERANGKSSSSALSFGGTPFSPSTPSLFSPNPMAHHYTPNGTASGSFASSSASTTPVISTLSPPITEKPDTILVLKNLPFSLKQDQLQEILMQMNTTAPQSINLHFDNAGVFKGMAFIKYRGIEDAIKVFDALNGYDVGGRKVRVEYKRKNKGQQTDIPQEWCDEEALRQLWDQIKDFSNNPNVTEISFAPTLKAEHKKQVHAMAEKLKLSHQSSGDASSICIRKTASLSAPTTPVQNNSNNNNNNSHSNHTSPVPTVNGNHHESGGKGISINKSRSRTNSETRMGSPRDGASAGSFSEREFRSPRGSFSKYGVSPAVDVNPEWRSASLPATSPASTPTSGGLIIAPLRQPKGPDGSRGFSDVYRNARVVAKKAIVV